jgi:Mrp family chromosome partitioning ATPase
MGDVLRGTIEIEEHFKRLGENDFHGGHNIAFGFNDVIEPFAAELLQDPRATEVMNTIQQAYQPDVMLFDLPPALYYDDVIAFRPQFDGVLLVIGGGLTTEKEIREVERRLGDTTPLLGMVLNKAENADFQKYQY